MAIRTVNSELSISSTNSRDQRLYSSSVTHSSLKDSLGWFHPIDSAIQPTLKVRVEQTPICHFATCCLVTKVFHSTQKTNCPTPYPIHTSTNPLYSTFENSRSSNMPARTAERNDRNMINGARRWVVNGSGQFVDAEADPTWGLTDEIGRLKIADVASDTETARLPVRTPPNSKLSAAVVAQISDNSPLGSSSSNSSSPQTPDQQITHSRGASADSNPQQPAAGNTHVAHPPLKNAVVEGKERPHSFSGGLSTADLLRLQQVGDSDDRSLQQQQQWAQPNADQLSYPSLANHVHRPLPQQFSYPNNNQQFDDVDNDDRQLEYQQRSFGSVPPQLMQGPLLNQNALVASPRPQFVQARPEPALNYNRTPRNFALQGPSSLSYGNNHTSHLSLGNTQQLYEMMLPPHVPLDNHPLVNRAQQHNVFRAGHHHTSSDPSALRDAATLAMLTNNFNAGMFQHGMLPAALPSYNQYLGRPDLAIQQQIASLQYNYGHAAGAASSPGLPIENGVPSPPESVCNSGGPSANNRKLGLYKTELCRSWEEKGTCRYGTKCQFAHGEDELRRVARHPKVTSLSLHIFVVSLMCFAFIV